MFRNYEWNIAYKLYEQVEWILGKSVSDYIQFNIIIV